MTDSHCHLTRLADARKAVADARLDLLVTVGTSLADSREAVRLARELDGVWAAVGIHPNEASKARNAAEREGIEALAAEDVVVAVGETGFDTHWQDETLDAQRKAFEWHAELARSIGKPLILHVRDAAGTDDASRAAARAVATSGVSRGVLHCFNGDPALLEVGLHAGWHVSFAGNLTYPSADAIREAARIVPDDRLLVETDSPFLSPVPKRGERNSPSNVRLTAGYLAEVRGVDPGELEFALDENARALFRLEPST